MISCAVWLHGKKCTTHRRRTAFPVSADILRTSRAECPANKKEQDVRQQTLLGDSFIVLLVFFFPNAVIYMGLLFNNKIQT